MDDGDAVLVGQTMETDENLRKERARLLLQFAMDTIRSEVHDCQRRWTWERGEMIASDMWSCARDGVRSPSFYKREFYNHIV